MIFEANLEEDGEIVFLTFEDIEFIHNLALIEGGRTGELKTSDLQSALGRPLNYHQYDNQNDLIRLAAVLWHGVSEAHGFVDGNKRTAMLAALAFLEANGIELDSKISSWQPGFFVDTSYQQRKFNIDTLDHYLRTHCRWIAE
ncbi:type II toxin-antitoxin system death-on-curing family toxin [Loktanella agnita]|uniref:type II toxin-antitoxin system death-on-curing family toxin n=1 Tax=Loktanella agnita TaxID=287097 RepID=UPI003985B002